MKPYTPPRTNKGANAFQPPSRHIPNLVNEDHYHKHMDDNCLRCVAGKQHLDDTIQRLREKLLRDIPVEMHPSDPNGETPIYDAVKAEHDKKNAEYDKKQTVKQKVAAQKRTQKKRSTK